MTKLGKVLRIIGIILMGLTAVFHLLGGIGTTCVAFGAEKYDSMAGLVDFKWLYQLFVVLTVIIGIAGIWMTINLIRGRKNCYRNTMIVLTLGLVLSGIHVYASQTLRGAAAPNNMRAYLNAFTLVVFLIFRIPGIWKQIDFEKKAEMGSSGAAAGLAMIVAGVAILTVQYWAASTHTWGGLNFADVWHMQLLFAGGGLLIAGLFFLGLSILPQRIAPRNIPVKPLS